MKQKIRDLQVTLSDECNCPFATSITSGKVIQSFADAVRRDALEEAARIADRNDMSAWGIAMAIRALLDASVPATSIDMVTEPERQRMARGLCEKFGTQCAMPEVAMWMPIARAALALAERP